MIVGSALFGCATSRVIPEPGKITLEDAMEQVAKGLNKMYEMGKGYPKTGLIPTEVTVVFNVSASAKDEGKLYIEVGATISDILKITKAGADVSSKIEASRGNQVTVKFTNLFLSTTKESLIMIKKPEEIVALLEALKGAGYEPIIKMK